MAKESKLTKIIESNIQATLSVMNAYEIAKNTLLQSGIGEEVAYQALKESKKSIDDIEMNGANNICVLAVAESDKSFSLEEREALHTETKSILHAIAEIGWYNERTIEMFIERIEEKMGTLEKDNTTEGEKAALDYEPLE